tara:strand:+ start:255 stop:764 length:510 start_codon:yes stop_codon:yes gene_type:complete
MSKSKKTVTATAQAEATPLAEAIAAAIASDVSLSLQAKQSGAEVATAFDNALPGINWAAFKGNAGADKCGMEVQSYKLVKAIRSKYRDAWNEADLPNFDQRWKYVQSCSELYVAPIASDKAGKSTEAKLEEAVRAVFRHATTLDNQYIIDIARDACDHLGLEIKDESGE